MKFMGLNRSLKTRILLKLLEGQTAPLASLRKPLSPDLSQWTNEELQTEYERIRQKQYRQKGVLPPPMPNFGAMSLEQLYSYKAARFKAI
ncbi:hypothetical protein [Spirosoma fluviale]|uniref:Uncharacterized protein n=1 Tax=Spirosoma fluviale TaxID=1597977 RepID=A0A286GXG2_9BACT|nr:hypothetical protein [Spirosoma fluviale]SOD99769.1 hypothetical protein SAMN06269250_0154 [Spirosoma fluviale]